MLTDVFGLGMAIAAIKLGESEASAQKTYGYYRAEILAATTNALLLALVSIYIFYEAHLVLEKPEGHASALAEAQRILHENFEIGHSTLQMEPSEFGHTGKVHD